VRGNIDDVGELEHLPEDARFTKEGVDIYMTHIGAKPQLWLPRLPRPRPHVAICGHSHVSLLERSGGVLFLNPGAAGTVPRFGAPLSAAILTLREGVASAEVFNL
jgi:predicted phosphodiesterase